MQTRASRKRRLEGNESLPLVSKSFDWNQLPIDLWLEISKHFSFMELFQMRRVSRTFNRAINSCISCSNRLSNSSLYRKAHSRIITNQMIEQTFSPPNRWQTLKVLELEGWYATMVSTSLAKISKNAKNLEEISISCENIKRMHFRSFIKSYPRLRRFKLMSTGGSLSLDSLKSLFNNCQLLTQLSLSFRECRFEFNGVDVSNPVEASKQLFPNRSPHLVDLHLFFPDLDLIERLDPLICATFSQSLVKLSNHLMPKFPMPNLVRINTTLVDLMEHPRLDGTDEQALFSYWNQFPKLRSLCLIRGERHFHHRESIAVSTAVFSLPNCPVRNLSFDYFWLDDLSLLRGIERLSFGQCEGLFCDNLKNMLLNNQSLKDLSLCKLEDFSDDLLLFIGANCKQLEFLSIGDNRGFNFTHLLAFAEAHRAAVGASSIVKISARSKKDFFFSCLLDELYFISQTLGVLTESIEAANDELLKSHGVHLLRKPNRSSSSSNASAVIPDQRSTSEGN